MKTIAVNSVKGGTGKSTLAVILTDALTGAGHRCLVMDADASNNSLSSYFGDSAVLVQSKTIFDLFMWGKLRIALSGLTTASISSGAMSVSPSSVVQTA